MYTRLLRKLAHTKKFTISQVREGWRVCEEEDSRLVLSVRYKDWHRVERAIETFANKAKSLQQHGWADHVVTVLVERPSAPSSTAFQLHREHAQKL
jgi:hypothetical protein